MTRGDIEHLRRVAFYQMLTEAGLPHPEEEVRFHETRQWRFDFAWPDHRLALEVEGGVWTNGRHTRGKGYIKDMEKYTEANLLGWRIIRVVPGELASDRTIALIKRGLTTRAIHHG